MTKRNGATTHQNHVSSSAVADLVAAHTPGRQCAGDDPERGCLRPVAYRLVRASAPLSLSIVLCADHHAEHGDWTLTYAQLLGVSGATWQRVEHAPVPVAAGSGA